MKRILIACEYSGAVREAFRKRGFDAWSCDLLPTEIPGQHYEGDLFDIIDAFAGIAGAHPPCTFMTNSGVRWLFNSDGSKNLERWAELENGVNFFNRVKSKIKTGYLENPIPHKYARDGFFSVVSGKWVEGIGNYSQVIQPYMFGHGEQKATCIWLKNLPLLRPTNIVEGREQRVWKLPPGPDRWKERSRTFQGIADAFADQFGKAIMQGYTTPKQAQLFSV